MIQSSQASEKINFAELEECLTKIVVVKPFALDWDYVSLEFHSLSEGFIERFRDYIDWEYISYYQTLSEEFIERFQDYVDWEVVSCIQALSEPFIEKYADDVEWDGIFENQTLSKEFKDKWQFKLTPHF